MSSPIKYLCGTAFICFLLPALSGTCMAQPGQFGLGIQIGSPTGITGKYVIDNATAFDFAAAWHINQRFIFQGHYILSQGPIDAEVPLDYYMGVGGFLSTGRGASRVHDDFEVGVSGNFGMAYYYQTFEFFAQLTPQLGFVPATRGNFGAAIGARYYFN